MAKCAPRPALSAAQLYKQISNTSLAQAPGDEPRNVYVFYAMGGVGFKIVRDVVTDTADGTMYHIGKAVTI